MIKSFDNVSVNFNELLKKCPCKTLLLGGMLFIAVQSAVLAQRVSIEEVPELWERAIVMHCISRIVENNENVVWDSTYSRVTLPGRPVAVQLVGANLVIIVQFTAFVRPFEQYVLLAHVQTWISIPSEGISYHTSLQTIPVELNEIVLFLPLGPTEDSDEARIEIQVVLESYTGNLGDYLEVSQADD